MGSRNGFGLMLAVGDLTYAPFIYSFQASYFIFPPVKLGPIHAVAVILVNLLGYYIFREDNT
jgi:delta14-sterol reductase